MGFRRKQEHKFTADEISQSLCLHLLSRSKMAVPNYYIGKWECDVLSYDKKGIVTEFEIKISRSDFLNDSKKSYTRRWYGETVKKADVLQSGERVNKFVYVCPQGMIDKSELPPYAGLVEVSFLSEERLMFTYIKVPKSLNDTPLLDSMKEQLLFKLPYKICCKKYGFTEELKE